MNSLTKRKLFFFLGIMLFISSLLMLIANNVPIFASFRWLWGPIFILTFIVFEAKYLTNKMVIKGLCFGFLYCFILQYTIWDYASSWYKQQIFEDFYAMFVSILLYTSLVKNGYIKEWGYLSMVGLFFILITGLMTLVATNIDPTVVRASYSGAGSEIANYPSLERLGFGSYGFMSSIISFLPIVVFFMKYQRNMHLKLFFFFVLLFSFIILIKAQIFANIIIATLFTFLSLIISKNNLKTLLTAILVLVGLFSLDLEFWNKTFLDLSIYFSPESSLYYKLLDASRFIDDPEFQNTTGAGLRAERYPQLIEAFLAQPLFGDASYDSSFKNHLQAGGHLYWMSRLALWGLFGFIGYLIILRGIFLPIFRSFDKIFRVYYLLSLISIISLGLIKNLAGREPWLMLMIIIPGVYYYSKGI